MIVRLLSAALAAGLLAAIIVTGLELSLTSPLIIEAERYEAHDATHAAAFPGIVLAHAEHAHGPADGDKAAAEWQPAAGLQRMAFTGLATLVGAVGYALLLGATMLAVGAKPTPERALGFAVAGFLSVALAPALGSPELPGSEVAPLAARQAWWAMTAISTAMGLYLIAVRRVPITILGGLVLIVAPHIAGAPEAPDTASALPAGLAAQFAARSLGIAFVFWAAIGLGYGWAWQRFGRKAPERARA